MLFFCGLTYIETRLALPVGKAHEELVRRAYRATAVDAAVNVPQTAAHKLHRLDTVVAGRASPAKIPSLIVVEGPLTVLYLAQHGIGNAVATFGAAMSDEQAEILAGTGRSVILILDGDEAGCAGMRTAAAKLITRAFVRAIKLPDNSKPAQFSAEDITAILA